MAADLETPTAGTITVNGMSPAEAREERAYGYVFQAAGLFPWRTIGGNVRLPLEIMGYGRAERRQRMARVLELVELGGFEKKYPWQLSGGMQQRASIARALAFDADILLMDEPFGALDEIVRDRLNEELLGLWARTGKTICFVTHSIPEAVFLSTRIVVMSPRPGRVTDVIESHLPRERPLHIRESREFLEIAARVRDGLRAGVGGSGLRILGYGCVGLHSRLLLSGEVNAQSGESRPALVAQATVGTRAEVVNDASTWISACGCNLRRAGVEARRVARSSWKSDKMTARVALITAGGSGWARRWRGGWPRTGIASGVLSSSGKGEALARSSAARGHGSNQSDADSRAAGRRRGGALGADRRAGQQRRARAAGGRCWRSVTRTGTAGSTSTC